MGNGWDYGFWHAYLPLGCSGAFWVRGHGACFTTGFWQEWSKWAWVVKANSLLLLLSSEDTKLGWGKSRARTASLWYVFAVGLSTYIIRNQSSVIVGLRKPGINQTLHF